MNPSSHRRISANWSSASLRNVRKMKPPRTELISLLRVVHTYVIRDFFIQSSLNLDHCITNNLRMSALRQVISFSSVLYAVERKAANIDNAPFDRFSDTRLYIMALVLEPRQYSSGLDF